MRIHYKNNASEKQFSCCCDPQLLMIITEIVTDNMKSGDDGQCEDCYISKKLIEFLKYICK